MKFLNDSISITGGETLKTTTWIELRKEAYSVYRNKFMAGSIQNLSQDDFAHFLTFKGNQSWTNLQRGCKRVIEDMGRLRETLVYLGDETIQIETRLSGVSQNGRFYVKGFGKNLITGLLHVFDWKKYGIWNNRSQKVLNRLGCLPYISTNFGQSYIRVNKKLQILSDELNTDLVHVDGFLWWLDDSKNI